MTLRRTYAYYITALAIATLLHATTTTNSVVEAADSQLCSTTTCLANGDTECDRTTSTSCPVCMYAISGGFSCYDKINGQCPYPEVLATCSKPSRTPTITPAAATATTDALPATVAPARVDSVPVAPTITPTTKAPVTRAPQLTITPTSSTRPSNSTTTSSTHLNSLQNNPTTSTSKSTMKPPETAGAAPDHVVGVVSPTFAITPPPSSSTTTATTTTAAPSTELMDALEDSSTRMRNSDDNATSSTILNIGIVLVGVGAIAVVALFIVQRIQKRRQADATIASSSSSLFFTTLPLARMSDKDVCPTNSSCVELPPSLLSMDSRLSTSTAEFQSMQQYRHHEEYDASASGNSSNSSQVSVSSAALGFRHLPPAQVALTRLRDRASTTTTDQQRPVHLPVYQEQQHRKTRAMSSIATGNVYEDEYDIVKPGALHDDERRNTERLVLEGRFQSNFSEHDVQLFAREHEI